MFDFEFAPNGYCIRENCKYLKKTSTNQYDSNGYPENLELHFCKLDVKERFDKCPLWLKSCREIGLFDEVRFDKTKLPDKEGFTIYDNWYCHHVNYLPIFTDEYQCDKFVEWLNELYGGGV